MTSYIAIVFGEIGGLVKRNTKGRTSFDIDYDMLKKRDIRELRFVIGKIVMETIRSAVDHEVMAQREKDPIEKEIVEKRETASSCQSPPAKNTMFSDVVLTRVKRELKQEKEEKLLKTKRQKVIRTEDSGYVAKLEVTDKERPLLSQSKVAKMQKTVANCEEEIAHGRCNFPEGDGAAKHNKQQKSQASKGEGRLHSLSALFK